MFDYRYHFISLAAVFLALGLGVLFGGALGGDEALVHEQQELASRLEREFEALRQQNQQVRAEAESYRQAVATYEQFARQVFPLLVGGRLAGRLVTVLDMGGGGAEAVQALEAAGASVRRIALASNWRYSPQTELAGLAPELGLTAVRNDREMWGALADCLAEAAAGQGDSGRLAGLVKRKLVSLSGAVGAPADAVVMVGSGDRPEMVRLLDVPLLKRLRAAGLTVVGAQRRVAGVSPIPAYQEAGVPTVDNLESVAGQVSLIWSLAGQPGNYGVEETAASLLPDWRELPEPGGEARVTGASGSP